MDQSEGVPLENLTPQGRRASHQQVNDTGLGPLPSKLPDPRRRALDPFIVSVRSSVEKISSGFTKLHSQIVFIVPRRSTPTQASATPARPNTNRRWAATLTALKEFWNKVKSFFNDIKNSFSRPGPLAITSCLITFFGIIIAAVALIPAYQSLSITKWDAQREFLKHCLENIDTIAAEAKAACDSAIKKGLQSPPYVGKSASLAKASRKFLRDTHIRQDNCTSSISEGFSPEAFFLALPTISTGAGIGIGVLLVLFYLVWMLNATYLLKRYFQENVLLKLIRRYHSALGSGFSPRPPLKSFLRTLEFIFAPITHGRPIDYAKLAAYLGGFLILAIVATLFPQAVYLLYSKKLKITARLVYDNLQSFCNTNTGSTFSACKSNVQPPSQASLRIREACFVTISFLLSSVGVPVGMVLTMTRALAVQIRVMDEEARETALGQGAVPTGNVVATTPGNLSQDRNSSESSFIPDFSAPISIPSVDSLRRNMDDDFESLPLPSSRARSRGRRRGRALPSATASGAATAISSATAWKDLTPAAVRRALLQVPDEQVDQILRILQRRKAIISRLRAREEDTEEES